MSSAIVCVLVFVCTTLGLVLGSLVRMRLPGHHLKDESRDVVKTASGIIATLVALVLGLLVASSKATFDSAAAGMNQAASRVILLNRALERYGPEADRLRHQLRLGLERRLELIWPEEGRVDGKARKEVNAVELDHVEEGIARLNPTTEAQKRQQHQAEVLAAELVQSRWTIFVQAHGELPTAFLAVLVFWLFVLYLMLGLLCPRTVTAWVMLILCVGSVALALFVVLEMTRPLDGCIQVPSTSLREALRVISATE